MVLLFFFGWLINSQNMERHINNMVCVFGTSFESK